MRTAHHAHSSPCAPRTKPTLWEKLVPVHRSLSYQPAEGMDSPLSLGGLLLSLSLDPACRTFSKRVPIDSLRPKQFAAQTGLPAWVYARAIFPADFAGECSPPPPWPWPRKAPWQLLCRCLLLPLPSLAIPQRKMCAMPSKSRKSNRHHSRGALIWVHAAPTAAHRRPTPHSHCLISLRTTAATARLRSRVNQYGLALKGVRDFTHRAGWMLFQSCPAVDVYVFRRPPAGYVPLLC